VNFGGAELSTTAGPKSPRQKLTFTPYRYRNSLPNSSLANHRDLFWFTAHLPTQDGSRSVFRL
jgi:hypothetical protein